MKNFISELSIHKLLAKFKTISKRKLLFSACFSWFIGITLVLGYQIQKQGMTLGGFSGKFLILLYGLLIGIILLPLFYFLFHLAVKDRILHNSCEVKSRFNILNFTFLFSWGVIFLCWVPVFLAYYPAVMSYDFNVQSIQVTLEAYHTHHPLIHTGLLWIFFQIGKLIGSYQFAMALFALFQMLIMSCIFAYSITFVWRFTKKRWCVALALVFFGLLPVHSVLSVSITKDVLFSGFFLLFILLMCEREQKHTLWLDICFILVGILMIMFRNNAIYAFIPFAVFYIIINRREWLKTLLLCLLITFLGKASLLGLQYGMNAGTGSIAEMCSVPMQQFARVGSIHQDTLSEDDYNTINWYVHQEYWRRYNPPIADTVKITVSADGIENWEENLPKTIADWLKIGLHYPNEYLDAFLCLTSGYWYLYDTSYADVLGADLEGRMGILYTFNASASSAFEGIETHSLFPWLEARMEEVVSANAFFDWPVLSLLFKPSLYCLFLLFAGLVFWYRKEWKNELYVLFPLLYLATLLLGPVALMRYAYPFVILAPFLLCKLIRYK